MSVLKFVKLRDKDRSGQFGRKCKLTNGGMDRISPKNI